MKNGLQHTASFSTASCLREGYILPTGQTGSIYVYLEPFYWLAVCKLMVALNAVDDLLKM